MSVILVMPWCLGLGGALPAEQLAVSSGLDVAGAKPGPVPGFVLTASIKELMQGVVDPAADVVFDSVHMGTREIRPRTDEQWAVIRKNALILAEAGNLLKMPGRRVAPSKPIPGTEHEPVGPEDLTPAQIQGELTRDRSAFDRGAQALTDAALIALRAVDARNVDGLWDAGEALDSACENCHLRYWYPPKKRPVRAPVRKP